MNESLNESVETTYLTHTYLETSNQQRGGGGGGGREGARIRKDSLKYTANDPQLSMQQDTKALQVSRGPPRKSCTVKGETADYIGLSLTLPKLYLATYNKQLLDEVERKPNSIIVLLYSFHIIHPQKQKRSVQPFCF